MFIKELCPRCDTPFYYREVDTKFKKLLKSTNSCPIYANYKGSSAERGISRMSMIRSRSQAKKKSKFRVPQFLAFFLLLNRPLCNRMEHRIGHNYFINIGESRLTIEECFWYFDDVLR